MLAVATIILIVTGVYQVLAIKRENRHWQTLAACDRYNYDSILDRCLRELRDAKKAGIFFDNEKNYRLEITTVLNCLEGIAIGISQGLFIEDLVRDHMYSPVVDHVNEFLTDGMPKKIGIDPHSFPFIEALNDKWTAISRTRYRGHSWWQRWRRRL